MRHWTDFGPFDKAKRSTLILVARKSMDWFLYYNGLHHERVKKGKDDVDVIFMMSTIFVRLILS